MLRGNCYGRKKLLLLLGRLPLELSKSSTGRTSPISPPSHRYQSLVFFSSSAAAAAQLSRGPISSRLLLLRSSWPSSAHDLSRRSAAALLQPKLPPSAVALAKAHRSFSSSVGVKSFVDDGLRVLRISLQRRPGGFGGVGGLFSSTRRLWRSFRPTSDEVVMSLIGANVAVFFLWHIADPAFMRKNFMISLDNFKSGRLHTLITCAFSHSDLSHLFSNMIGLYFFGTSIANLFGPKFLLKLYLAGALGGSIFFLVHKALMVPSRKGYRGWDESKIPALGASGAVNAIILLKVFLFPKEIYYLNLIIPVPAMLMGALLIGTDLWRIKQGEGNISGSAHLGGAVVAALVWARIRKGWI